MSDGTTLKDDIEALRDMVAKLEGNGLWSDRAAAERVIALAERATSPTLAALLPACDAVALCEHPRDPEYDGSQICQFCYAEKVNAAPRRGGP
jgi:hypothetical protein